MIKKEITVIVKKLLGKQKIEASDTISPNMQKS